MRAGMAPGKLPGVLRPFGDRGRGGPPPPANAYAGNRARGRPRGCVGPPRKNRESSGGPARFTAARQPRERSRVGSAKKTHAKRENTKSNCLGRRRGLRPGVPARIALALARRSRDLLAPRPLNRAWPRMSAPQHLAAFPSPHARPGEPRATVVPLPHRHPHTWFSVLRAACIEGPTCVSPAKPASIGPMTLAQGRVVRRLFQYPLPRALGPAVV